MNRNDFFSIAVIGARLSFTPTMVITVSVMAFGLPVLVGNLIAFVCAVILWSVWEEKLIVSSNKLRTVKVAYFIVNLANMALISYVMENMLDGNRLASGNEMILTVMVFAAFIIPSIVYSYLLK